MPSVYVNHFEVACQDPTAINCPNWCPECPNYDPDLVADWVDMIGQPYECIDWHEMHDPFLEMDYTNVDAGYSFSCEYESWCPQDDCLDPTIDRVSQWFANKTPNEFTVSYCNNTNRHIMAFQNKIHTLVGMEMGALQHLAPGVSSPPPVGKGWSTFSSVSNDGTQLSILSVNMWANDTIEEQLIFPHETISNFYTFYGNIPDHLCITFNENVVKTWLPEPVPVPCPDPDLPEETIQSSDDWNHCYDGIGKGGFVGISATQYEETGGLDCTQPGACNNAGGYCRNIKIHPDDYPQGTYTFEEDCTIRGIGQLQRLPVCINSTPQTQCNWCDNPVCPEDWDEGCSFDWLYCCLDVDGDEFCDESINPVNYCCGETCSDCYHGQDSNNDGIDDSLQMLDLDGMMPPLADICFDQEDAIGFCCQDKQPKDGECDDSYNPNLWVLSCINACPKNTIPVDMDEVGDAMMEGIQGCNDPYAWNFHPWAFMGCESGTMSCCDYNNDGIPDEIDDGWEGVVYGCRYQFCDNYNPEATVNDGSCCGTHLLCGPTLPDDSWTWEFITECGYDCTAPDALCGCTETSAMNYDPTAIVDDGSCRYTPGTEPSGPPPEDCLQCTSDRDCFNQFGYTDTGAMFCNMTYITPGEIGCCEERSPGTRPLPPRPIGRRQLDRLGDINQDYQLNQADLNQLNSFILSLAAAGVFTNMIPITQLYDLDVNNDGNIDVNDLDRITELIDIILDDEVNVPSDMTDDAWIYFLTHELSTLCEENFGGMGDWYDYYLQFDFDGDNCIGSNDFATLFLLEQIFDIFIETEYMGTYGFINLESLAMVDVDGDGFITVQDLVQLGITING